MRDTEQVDLITEKKKMTRQSEEKRARRKGALLVVLSSDDGGVHRVRWSALPTVARVDKACRGCPAASIHPIADKADSWKPLFTLSDAYALGPVLRADSSSEKRF